MTGVQPGQPIGESELLAITDNEMRQAIAYMGGKLSEQRRRNEYYYLGLAKGELAPPSIDSRSAVVSTDVADTVEWMLPSLLKTFAATDSAVEFAPTQPQDEAAAKQATDVVNYVFHKQNPGFQLLYTWFKDALLQKVGVLKLWWDDREDDTTEEYEDQGPEDLALLMQDPSVEIVAASPDGGDEAEEGITDGHPRWTVRIRRRSVGQVRVEAVPPEEFLISRRAKSLTDTPFCAHRVERTLSDLRAMGYKGVDELASDDTAASLNGERIERRSFDDELAYIDGQHTAGESSQRTLWVTECYLRLDYDRDGVAEWRKVVRAGGKILENEECDGPPFVAITPIPLPHRFFGLCPADQAVEVQRVKTAVMRSLIDNLYLSINGRSYAVEGQVNLDDLLTVRPGGVVRVKSPAAVGPLQVGMGDARGGYQMLEQLENWKENRTGWTRYSQGTGADSLNKTATGVNIITGKSDMRLELIARVFAETGVKDLFRRILKLVSQYQRQAMTVQLTGGWAQVNPREWRNQFDFSVNVGLGTGNKDQVVAHLSALGQVLQQVAPMGLVTPRNAFNLVVEMARNMGLKNPEKYVTDPDQIAQQNAGQPPKPDPKMEEMQARMQLEQARMQLDAQLKREQMGIDAQLKAEELRIKAQAEQVKLSGEFEAAVRAEVARFLAGGNVGAGDGLVSTQ